VETNHAHDKMVQTSDHHHSPLGSMSVASSVARLK
jgi:hypothetical protein